MDMHCIHFVVGLCVFARCVAPTSTTLSQCQVQDGRCTYLVNLAPASSCSSATSSDDVIDFSLKPEALRRSDHNTVEQLQSDFSTIKSDHENRIKELENSIQKLLRNAFPDRSVTYAAEDVYVEKEAETKQQLTGNMTPEKSGNLLLFQLQGQFNRMAASLSERTADLMEARNKLNATTELLHATQKQAHESSSNLVSLQTKSKVLERQTNILKNKLKDKTERLDYANERLNTSETKLLQTEDQLYDIVRAESTAREELETLKIVMNRTMKQLEDLKRNHSELTTKYKRTKRTLNLREEELMECYSGKVGFCPHR